MLNHDLDPTDAPPRDACGVFGLWAPAEEVAKITYFGLYALQHRGQESAGIATSDGERIMVYKDMGLVSQVFSEGTMAGLQGHLAIGHTRYSTTGASKWENAQPTLGKSVSGTIALAHNGNLVNADHLADLVSVMRPNDPGELKRGNTSDTALVTSLLHGETGETLFDTALRILPKVRGAFSFVFMDENKLYAARDPFGVRPLALGQMDSGGWVVASETAALNAVGAQYQRDIKPGELVVIDETGVKSQMFAQETPGRCVFEHVYLARPDSVIDGRSVYESRVEMGRLLAKESPVDADVVIGVPESGIPAAIGYAEASGIPYSMGFMKNAYVGRTFIQPSQTLRQLGVKLKLNPLRSVIEGKRLVVIDDSIVRGNTQRKQIKLLREVGAAEVHVRISSPPVKWPCFYGIDFASREELIANDKNLEGIRQDIGADSLAYISVDGMVEATTLPAANQCTACFTGRYPIGTPGQGRQNGSTADDAESGHRVIDIRLGGALPQAEL